MPEDNSSNKATSLNTFQSLCDDLVRLGLRTGHIVLVHSSFSEVGFVAGGAHSMLAALLEVIGTSGTVMMPTHTGQNTDPANWKHPPVPKSWWSAIRETSPAFDPARTPTRGMGVIAELFRTWPGVKRSAHPIGSFAASGQHAEYLLQDHTSLTEMFGETSPIRKLYELDGHVLLLGVGHHNNTSLHLAEYRATYPDKRYIKEGTALHEAGVRRWQEFEMLALDSDDFTSLGADYASSQPGASALTHGNIGMAASMYMRQRPLVDFALDWMHRNRV